MNMKIDFMVKSVSVLMLTVLFVAGCVVETGTRSGLAGIEFKWFDELGLTLGSPISEDPDWFYAYDLSDSQMKKLLANDLSKYGYTGWRDYTRNSLLGTGPSYRLDSKAHKIKVNYVAGSDNQDQVAIFINLSKKELVLFYGRTYGM